MSITQLGDKTKSIFLVGPESHKLSLEFEAIGDIGVLTFSADLVAGDAVNLSINGEAMDEVGYASSHSATMAAIAAAIEDIDGVLWANVHGATSRVISFLLEDATADVLITNAVVTNGGAGTAAVVSSVITGGIAPGTPVILTGIGEKVAPASVFANFGIANAKANILGISLHGNDLWGKTKGGLVTVVTRGYAVVFGQASSSVSVGPVDYSGHDTDTGYGKYVTGTANGTIGLALDEGSDGDVIRILMFH